MPAEFCQEQVRRDVARALYAKREAVSLETVGLLVATDLALAEAAIEALRPHFARLLVGALGGEEAVVERMARAAYPELWQLRERALADSTLQIRRDAAMERVTRGLRSLMEDTPNG